MAGRRGGLERLSCRGVGVSWLAENLSMAYMLHLERDEPFCEEEWRAVVDSEPSLALFGDRISFSGGAFELGGEARGLALRLAQRLGARVVGDEGELYSET